MSKTIFEEEIFLALSALSEWLAAEQIAYASIGGIAVSLIAQPRVTQDIDAVIWLDSEQWQTFLDSGIRHGIVPRIADAAEFARESRVFLLKHKTTNVNLDLSCGALPFEQEMIERAVSIKIEGLTIRVATAEDLVITKSIAHRGKDLGDIDTILRTVEDLDQARIRYWVAQFAEIMEMPEMIESLERQLTAPKSTTRRAGRKRPTKRGK